MIVDCMGCRNWRPILRSNEIRQLASEGHCTAFPPEIIVLSGEAKTVYPVTMHSDRCSEFFDPISDKGGSVDEDASEEWK